MRLLLGVLAVAAGSAALTALYVPSPATHDLAVVEQIGAGGVARLGVPAQDKSPPRFFGFAVAESESSSGRSNKPTAHIKSSDRAIDPPAPADPRRWTTDVVVYSGARESNADADAALIAPARVVAATTATPDANPTRVVLIRELQRELKRVGCYHGELDGDWGAGSKRSMRAFMERANSPLQSENPDLVMLTLVRGYTGNACRAAPGAATGVTSASIVPPLPVPAARPAFAPSPPPPAPAFTANIPTSSGMAPAVPAPVAVVRPPNLDGRMAVGGPMPAATQPVDPRSLTVAPVVSPAPRVQRSRQQTQAQGRSQQRSQAQSRNRNWTANFFNQ